MGVFNKKLEKGDIVLNNKNEDPIAASHPLFQISEKEALTGTTKETPKGGAKTIAITNADVVGFVIDGVSYVSTNCVANDKGKVVGKVKPGAFNRIYSFFIKNS